MIETFALRNGVVVLAKPNATFGTYPYTFANRTQAERRAAELRAMGEDACVYKSPFSRPFYVQLPTRFQG